VPAQSDGRPFFDGTEDALNFFLSTPAHSYVPVPSCNSGTSHAAKQQSRVAAGLDNGYNPFSSLLDPRRVGLAGHSYGAAGVSYIAQWDPRVKAVVAWDNLAASDPNKSINGNTGAPAEQGCVDASQRRPVPVTKPGLGLSADYFLPPTPNVTVPQPQAKSTESLAYSKAGVPSGELIIRGGSHLDFDYIPNSGFPATLRGEDLIAWYTTAWFDAYVKGDQTGFNRLLTRRWRSDAREAAVDPRHDGNMFSFYYRSRLALTLPNGSKVNCENLRAGCGSLVADDGRSGTYDVTALDTRPDGAATNTTLRGSGIYRWPPVP
jgi:hypothetical protein